MMMQQKQQKSPIWNDGKKPLTSSSSLLYYPFLSIRRQKTKSKQTCPSLVISSFYISCFLFSSLSINIYFIENIDFNLSHTHTHKERKIPKIKNNFSFSWLLFSSIYTFFLIEILLRRDVNPWHSDIALLLFFRCPYLLGGFFCFMYCIVLVCL